MLSLVDDAEVMRDPSRFKQLYVPIKADSGAAMAKAAKLLARLISDGAYRCYVKLPIPAVCEWAERVDDPHGRSLRVVCCFDIKSAQLTRQMDVLVGL